MPMERALSGRYGGEPIELAVGLDVDAEDVLIDRQREFGVGLADAGEHDLVRRNAGRAGTLELSAGDDIGAGAEPGERPDDRLIGICLQRVADERGHIRERAGEHPIVPLQRRGRVAIERRSD